jgi:1,4-alpha-glucan branching enzyme
LKFVDPSAHQVFVAGSFNNWHAAALPLKPSKGEWVGEVELAPGRYEYLFVVDGKWLPDPGAKETIPNPFGGFNSLLSIS